MTDQDYLGSRWSWRWSAQPGAHQGVASRRWPAVAVGREKPSSSSPSSTLSSSLNCHHHHVITQLPSPSSSSPPSPFTGPVTLNKTMFDWIQTISVEDVLLVEFMYLVFTLTCQATVTVGDSGPCCHHQIIISLPDYIIIWLPSHYIIWSPYHHHLIITMTSPSDDNFIIIRSIFHHHSITISSSSDLHLIILLASLHHHLMSI